MRPIPKEWSAMSKVFTALGDDHRQRILLIFEQGEHLNVGQIVEASPLSRSAVSHHLKVLKDANVLSSEKIGKEIYFWINKTFIQQTLANVLGYIKKTV